jgi:muramoyltetrapeptide carboxypeptidase
VAVVAPAGTPAPDAYRAGLGILAARYTVVHAYDPLAPRTAPLPYLAESDAFRAARLNEALRDPEVRCIFFARGGYGSMRLLELLDGEALSKSRPTMVGFSDITALHAWAACQRVPSIHGPVVTQLPRLPADEVQSLFDLLEGRAWPELTGLERVVTGSARGPLFAANLTVLCHLCGTPFLPDLTGYILLLEEIGEVPYRIDRLLTQLLLAGVLQRLAGIVVGDLIDCDAPQGEPPLPVKARSVIFERISSLGIPAALGARVGHGGHNLSLPLLGPTALLDTSNGTLTFLDPPGGVES